MRPKPKQIILCCLLVCFTSCVTIVKWRYGITNPKEQSPEKLLSFLEKHKFPNSCQYIFNDTISYFQCFRNSLFRENLIGHMIFDSGGSLVRRDTTQCQWSGYQLIRSLSSDSAYLRQSGLHLGEILGRIHPIGNTIRDSITGRPDFTLVVTWAAFLGSYNSRLFELDDAVTLNKSARIRVIWLNIDMQEIGNQIEQISHHERSHEDDGSYQTNKRWKFQGRGRDLCCFAFVFCL
ncbi:MAG: hypothetical protein NTW16_18860 [Bacteroidetes bacterium]|nr:hypothetical protein [Bacteroidota bacterium]